MTEHPAGPLGQGVDSWMRSRNVRPHQIEAMGGPKRGTLYLIRRGVTRRPTYATLRTFARAVATHPYTRDLDEAVMTACLDELSVAAGYARVADEDAASLLERALFLALRDRTRTQLWLALFRAHAQLGEAELVAAMARFSGPPRGERSIE